MSARRRPSRSFIVINTVMLWLVTLVATAALWPLYQNSRLIGVVVASLAVGTAIALVGHRFNWPGFVVVLATFASYLLFGVPLANPAGTTNGFIPTLDGELELLRATVLSWKQLVTITIPVGAYQTLLVPAMILVLASTVIAATVAFRTRWPELAVIAPVLLFIVATLFGPTFAFWPRALALTLLGMVLFWLMWLRAYKRRAAIRLLAASARDAGNQPKEAGVERVLIGWRSGSAGLVILLIAGSASYGATELLPPLAQREVLRAVVTQPFVPSSYASPLSGFRSYEKNPSAAMLTVTGLPPDARIRIATLDSYDGIVYTVGSGKVASESNLFTRVPYSFDQRTTAGTQVAITVQVGDYAGVWVPTIGQFESIDFSGTQSTALRDSFYYNNLSGTAAVVTPLTRGDRYSLTAVLPVAPTVQQLDSLSPGGASVPPVEVLPDSLRSTLDSWTGDSSTAGKKLAAMLAALKKNGYVSHGVSAATPASRSGHAADRITELLTAPRMIGDQEQYAVTAALMARQLGFPARVVMGFAPANITAGQQTTITSGDISAWIEVDTEKFGWVTIDPTPPVRTIPDETPQIPTTIARPQSPVQPPAQEPTTQNVPAGPSTAHDDSAAPNPLLELVLTTLIILGWTTLAAAIIAAPFVFIIAAKARRRLLRRRANSALERISGGWQEFEDAVVDHGFTPPPTPTRSEVAATIGGSKARILAAVADRAAFSPGQPRDTEADQVWQSVTALRMALGAKLTRRQRWKALISLRSLGGYSVKSLFKR